MSGRGKLFEKVKTAKGRKLSSTIWLKRQLNDTFVQLAQKEGFRSRAAYKLIGIDDKFSILGKPNLNIIDLGSAPGSWTQVIVQRAGKGSHIISLDLQEMDLIEGSDFIKCDFCTEQDKLHAFLGNDFKFDIILSDMAPSSIGHKKVDHLRIMGLCESVLDFAFENIKFGGCVVSKILQGGLEQEISHQMKQKFRHVKYFKPDASRKNSAEMFLVALDFKG